MRKPTSTNDPKFQGPLTPAQQKARKEADLKATRDKWELAKRQAANAGVKIPANLVAVGKQLEKGVMPAGKQRAEIYAFASRINSPQAGRQAQNKQIPKGADTKYDKSKFDFAFKPEKGDGAKRPVPKGPNVPLQGKKDLMAAPKWEPRSGQLLDVTSVQFGRDVEKRVDAYTKGPLQDIPGKAVKGLGRVSGPGLIAQLAGKGKESDVIHESIGKGLISGTIAGALQLPSAPRTLADPKTSREEKLNAGLNIAGAVLPGAIKGAGLAIKAVKKARTPLAEAGEAIARSKALTASTKPVKEMPPLEEAGRAIMASKKLESELKLPKPKEFTPFYASKEAEIAGTAKLKAQIAKAVSPEGQAAISAKTNTRKAIARAKKDAEGVKMFEDSLRQMGAPEEVIAKIKGQSVAEPVAERPWNTIPWEEMTPEQRARLRSMETSGRVGRARTSGGGQPADPNITKSPQRLELEAESQAKYKYQQEAFKRGIPLEQSAGDWVRGGRDEWRASRDASSFSGIPTGQIEPVTAQRVEVDNFDDLVNEWNEVRIRPSYQIGGDPNWNSKIDKAEGLRVGKKLELESRMAKVVRPETVIAAMKTAKNKRTELQKVLADNGYRTTDAVPVSPHNPKSDMRVMESDFNGEPWWTNTHVMFKGKSPTPVTVETRPPLERVMPDASRTKPARRIGTASVLDRDGKIVTRAIYLTHDGEILALNARYVALAEKLAGKDIEVLAESPLKAVSIVKDGEVRGVIMPMSVEDDTKAFFRGDPVPAAKPIDTAPSAPQPQPVVESAPSAVAAASKKSLAEQGRAARAEKSLDGNKTLIRWIKDDGTTEVGTLREHADSLIDKGSKPIAREVTDSTAVRRAEKDLESLRRRRWDQTDPAAEKKAQAIIDNPPKKTEYRAMDPNVDGRFTVISKAQYDYMAERQSAVTQKAGDITSVAGGKPLPFDKVKLDTELDELKKTLKQSFGKANSGLDPEQAKVLAQIAMNYAKRGVNSAVELVQAVQAFLKGEGITDVSDHDIMRAYYKAEDELGGVKPARFFPQEELDYPASEPFNILDSSRLDPAPLPEVAPTPLRKPRLTEQARSTVRTFRLADPMNRLMDLTANAVNLIDEVPGRITLPGGKSANELIDRALFPSLYKKQGSAAVGVTPSEMAQSVKTATGKARAELARTWTKGADAEELAKYGITREAPGVLKYVGRATGMTDIPFREFIKDLTAKELRKIGGISEPEIEMISNEEALRAVFANDNVVGTALKGLEQRLDSIGSLGDVAGIAVDIAIPFPKILANIAGRSTDYAIGAAKAGIWRMVMAERGVPLGVNERRVIASLVRRNMVGTALMYLGYQYGAPMLQGIDPKGRYTQDQEWAQAFGPLGVAVSMGARMKVLNDFEEAKRGESASKSSDAVAAMEERIYNKVSKRTGLILPPTERELERLDEAKAKAKAKAEEEAAIQAEKGRTPMVGRALSVVTDAFMDQPAISGVQQLVRAEETDSLGVKGSKMLATATVPAVVRNAARRMDTEGGTPKIESPLDAFKASVPGLRGQLPRTGPEHKELEKIGVKGPSAKRRTGETESAFKAREQRQRLMIKEAVDAFFKNATQARAYQKLSLSEKRKTMVQLFSETMKKSGGKV